MTDGCEQRRTVGPRLLHLANDNAAGYWLAQSRTLGLPTWEGSGGADAAAGGGAGAADGGASVVGGPVGGGVADGGGAAVGGGAASAGGAAAAGGAAGGTGATYAACRTPTPAGFRDLIFVRRRPADAAADLREVLLPLLRAWDTRELKVEDPYRVLELEPFGCEHGLDMPIMARLPGAEVRAPVRGVTAGDEVAVTAVEPGDPAALDAFERTVVEGFPVPDRLPWRRGVLFPPPAAGSAGVRLWLARRHGLPAAACVTYDAGEERRVGGGAGGAVGDRAVGDRAVGVYWVATLPEHRSRGVGRALLETVLAAFPDRVITLTATLAGEPLYRRLGFQEVGLSRWWRFPSAPRTGPA